MSLQTNIYPCASGPYHEPTSQAHPRLSNIDQHSFAGPSIMQNESLCASKCQTEDIPLFGDKKRVNRLTMSFLSAHCRVCKSDQFRSEPPETWVERVVLPRIFLCPGKCVVCHKRRYLPTFQRWTAEPNSWR